MRIVIPGSSGFIGSNLLNYISKNKKLFNKIDEIVLIDVLQYNQLPATKTVLSEKKIRFIKGSIYNPKLIRKVIRKGDVIIHLAVEENTFDKPQSSTTEGTLEYLKLLSEIQIDKFIFLSTADVYGLNNSNNLLENSQLKPSTIYAANKVGFEAYLQAFHALMNLPIIILRPVTIYGPNQYPGWLIPRIISRLLKNKKIQITGNGSIKRDWIYIDDICSLITKIIVSNDKKIFNEIFNVGTGKEKTVLQIVEYLLVKLNKPVSLIEFIPQRPGDILRQITHAEKVKKFFNWESKINFDKGIIKTINFYKTITNSTNI